MSFSAVSASTCPKGTLDEGIGRAPCQYAPFGNVRSQIPRPACAPHDPVCGECLRLDPHPQLPRPMRSSMHASNWHRFHWTMDRQYVPVNDMLNDDCDRVHAARQRHISIHTPSSAEPGERTRDHTSNVGRCGSETTPQVVTWRTPWCVRHP